LAASGCGSSALRQQLREVVDLQLRERGVDPDQIELPFDLSPEMEKWLREEADFGGTPENRLDQLLRQLLHRDGQELKYLSGHTGTAREVWETGTANCLAFTHLFIGMAREINLPVYYLRVSDLQSFEKDGDLVIVSEHITAAYGPPAQRRVLDFSDRPVTQYHTVQPIADLTATALYYSNRGAEKIREGETAEALEILELATRIDPELADAWINYGVAVRRSGRKEEAERAFRRALELDPSHMSAYQNLAALLTVTGRGREARELLAVTDRSKNRNPFSYLALGDVSMREGRLAEAERFYRRALRLDPGKAEPLAALGQWALSSGQVREARSWLKKAEKVDPENPRVGELARRLKTSTATG
jgi:Flp pilus assembly protein TadD